MGGILSGKSWLPGLACLGFWYAKNSGGLGNGGTYLTILWVKILSIWDGPVGFVLLTKVLMSLNVQPLLASLCIAWVVTKPLPGYAVQTHSNGVT